MSAVNNVWHQLVQRRLWPLAIVLIAALAAVPLLLSQEPEPVPAPAPVVSAGTDELAVAPIVAVAAASDRAKRPRILGAAKNPFAVVKPPKPATTVQATTSVATDTEASAPTTGGTTPAAGGGALPSTPAPVAPAPTTPEPAAKTYDKYDLTVRFGDAAAGTSRKTLERLQALPSAAAPVLIYLGVENDGETAVFLLDQGVEALGDGECKPSLEVCQTIRLRAGETEFFDVTDEAGTVTGQYQLDLVKVHKSSAASAARVKASKAGRRRLAAARLDGDGPIGYRWDAATGMLETRSGAVTTGTVVPRLP